MAPLTLPSHALPCTPMQAHGGTGHEFKHLVPGVRLQGVGERGQGETSLSHPPGRMGRNRPSVSSMFTEPDWEIPIGPLSDFCESCVTHQQETQARRRPSSPIHRYSLSPCLGWHAGPLPDQPSYSQVRFPGVSGSHPEKLEWLNKSSCRIWTGSYRAVDWKYLRR